MRGTVSEVSATLVASTMRRCGPGLNTRSWSRPDSRAYSGRTSVWAVLAPLQCLVRVADLALAGQEHQHVAERGSSRVIFIAPRRCRRRRSGLDRPRSAGPARFPERPIAHLHRIAAPFHADHRRTVEVLGEALGIDGGRGDDDLEVAARCGSRRLRYPSRKSMLRLRSCASSMIRVS
jgi:hypothetical protein